MILEWVLIVIFNGDDFGVIPPNTYATQAECESVRHGLLATAAKVGDTETKAYCAAREVVKKETI